TPKTASVLRNLSPLRYNAVVNVSYPGAYQSIPGQAAISQTHNHAGEPIGSHRDHDVQMCWPVHMPSHTLKQLPHGSILGNRVGYWHHRPIAKPPFTIRLESASAVWVRSIRVLIVV